MKWQTAGIKFTHRPKICTNSHEIWHAQGARGSAWPYENFMPIGSCGWERGPQNIKHFHFFGKESPYSGEPLNLFLNFWAFIRPTILH